VLMNELKDKWSLLFFGYTFCPDICPTTLAQLRQIKSELPKAVQDKLQVVLVSVDPQPGHAAAAQAVPGLLRSAVCRPDAGLHR
jgi:cytochrome oxidase Cu insertion factor (SCO1/SenC/PrrC family)